MPATMTGRPRSARRVGRRELVAAVHAAAPLLLGLIGFINIASAFHAHGMGRHPAPEGWLPLEVTQRSRPLMLFAGLALLQVTGSLARRKALAWWVSIAALGISIVLHLGHGLDLHHTLVASALVGYLVAFRRRFHARSDPASLKQALLMAPLLALAVWGYSFRGLEAKRRQFDWAPGNSPVREAFRSGILIVEPQVEPLVASAARFLGSVQIAGWLARLYLLVLVLRPVVLRRRETVPAAEAEAIVGAHGLHSLSAFALDPDKHLLRVAEGRALVAYAVRGPVALALGDPLAADADLVSAARTFVSYAERNGWRPCFYEAAEDRLPVYAGLGLRWLKIAEEAVLDLEGWSLAGGKRATVRSMVNKVTRLGWTVTQYRRALGPDAKLDEAIEGISQQWLAERRLSELGFSLGRFSLEALDHAWVFVARSPERVEAFTTWRPYRAGRAVVLDLMRKRPEAVSGAMDLLVAHSLSRLREAGFAQASLANAPLANVAERRSALDRGIARLAESLESFYGYRNLFQFKKKFAPRWEGRYLVYPRSADLPVITMALTRLHGGGRHHPCNTPSMARPF